MLTGHIMTGRWAFIQGVPILATSHRRLTVNTYKGVCTDPRGHTSLPDAQLTRIIIYPAADTVMEDNKSRMRYATSSISTLAKPLTHQSANQFCVTKSHLIIIPHATKVSCRRLHLFAPKTMLPRSVNPRYFFQIQYIKLARQAQALIYFIAGRNSFKDKRLAFRWLPSARFEQRGSSLHIWRCFRRARRVIVPPCNNQQTQPANTSPFRDQKQLGMSLEGPIAANLFRQHNRTLHTRRCTCRDGLAPLGAAVHRSTHMVQLSLEKRRIAFSLERETASAPRACHRADQRTWLAPLCAITVVCALEIDLSSSRCACQSDYSALCSERQRETRQATTPHAAVDTKDP